MKKLTIVTLTILFFSAFSFGQETEKKESKNMYGINFGATTGIGLSYKHWENKFGVQITGLPVKNDDNFDFSAGLTIFYSLKQKKYLNIFTYAGGNYMSSGFDFIFNMHPIYSFANLKRRRYYIVENKTNYDANYLNTSIGAGVELGKNPVVTIMAGYAGFDLTEEYKLFPAIELGLHFKINEN